MNVYLLSFITAAEELFRLKNLKAEAQTQSEAAEGSASGLALEI